jgi:VEFS-Box of polycomb protein
MEVSTDSNAEHSSLDMLGGALRPQPFLLRNMQYVWQDRRETRNGRCQSLQNLPVLRVFPLEIPSSSSPAAMRIWLIASPRSHKNSRDIRTLALAVREFKLRLDAESSSSLRAFPSSIAFDLSVALPYLNSHDLLLSIEIRQTGAEFPPSFVADIPVHSAMSCACMHNIVHDVSLNRPSSDYTQPRFAFTLLECPTISEVLDDATVYRSTHGQSGQHGLHQGERREPMTSSHQNTGAISLKGLKIAVKAFGARHNTTEVQDGAMAVSDFASWPEGGAAVLNTQMTPSCKQCVLLYAQRSDSSPSLQVYTLAGAPRNTSLVRPDFVCPLCLRFCRRVSTMLHHFDSDHENIVPSLVIFPTGGARKHLLSGELEFMPSILLHFAMTELELTKNALCATSSRKCSEDCTDSNRKSLADKGSLSIEEAGPWTRQLSELISTDFGPKESGSLALNKQTGGSGLVTSVQILNPSGSHWSHVIYVNTRRFPTWRVPLVDWNVEAGNWRRGSSNLVKSVKLSEVTPVRTIPDVVEDMEDAESDSTVADGEVTDRVKMLWSRCLKCKTLNASAYAYNPDFCSQSCERLHVGDGRLAAVSISEGVDSDLPPLSTLGTSKSARRSRVNFEAAFRDKTVFHLVSVAPFKAEHFDENDKDSEEEIDFSWRRQLNEEKLDALDVRPKQKVLWTMWNRFAFDKMAAGEYAERYTRFSLELFATLYRSEILRLGLRVEFMSFIRALHVHGCIDGTAIISALKCLAGQKSMAECSESMLPKGIDVEALRTKPVKKAAVVRRKHRRGKRV